MFIHIPPEIVNKHRLLTTNEISIYNLEPHIFYNTTPNNYQDTIFPRQMK